MTQTEDHLPFFERADYKEALWWDDCRECLRRVLAISKSGGDDALVEEFINEGPAKTEDWKTLSLSERSMIASFFCGWSTSVTRIRCEQAERDRESDGLSEAAII